VKLDEVHVGQSKAGSVESDGSAVGRSDEKLVERIDSAKRVGTHVTERAIAIGLGLLL
jgi:hypothetical protein